MNTPNCFGVRSLRKALFFATFALCLSCAGPDFAAPSYTEGGIDAGDEDAKPSTVVICTQCDDPTRDATAVDTSTADVATADVEGGGGDSTVSTPDGFLSSETAPAPAAGGDGSPEGGIDSGGCTAAEIACSGACVPNDTHHCGTCTNDCTALKNVSGAVSCMTGACAFPPSSCAAGYADCNGIASDGCETDITQPAHCGSCTIACSGGTPVCTASSSGYACVSGCPSTTPTLCGGTCADTTNNTNNCGACGNACTTTVTHAQPTCVSGACSFTCNVGYSPCNGACVDTTSDSNNCGSCGNACTGGMTCTQSACGCPGGTLDCSGTCAACSAPPSGGVNVCSGSTCTFACTGTGLTKCSASCTDMTSDGSNCGACGHSCQGGACSGGQCQPFVLGMFSQNMQILTINSTTAYAGVGNTAGGVSLVERCALTGCSASGAGLVATLSFSQFGIASSFLATDSGIFWYGQTSNTVTVGGYVNGSVVTYATYNAAAQSSPQTIAADTTNIYWTLNKGSTSGSNAVIACPVSGCPAGGPTILETGSTPMDITVAAGFLYWIDGTGPNQLMKCPIAGCGSTPTILGTNSTSNSWLLPIADSSNVYFAGNTGSNNSRLVLQCGVNGCPSSGPTELATSPNPYLAIDSTNVYWHTGNSVVSCGIGGCGGNPTTVFTNSSLPSTAPPIAVDATSIYWLNGASLMKIAK